MARRKNSSSNSRGYCDERTIEVYELNVCDYFHRKRKGSKVSCKNCAHFHVIDVSLDKPKPKQEQQNEKE